MKADKHASKQKELTQRFNAPHHLFALQLHLLITVEIRKIILNALILFYVAQTNTVNKFKHLKSHFACSTKLFQSCGVHLWSSCNVTYSIKNVFPWLRCQTYELENINYFHYEMRISCVTFYIDFFLWNRSLKTWVQLQRKSYKYKCVILQDKGWLFLNL